MGSSMASIGGSAMGIAGGILGNNAAESGHQAADALNARALEAIQSLNVPDMTKEILYQQYQSTGDLSPVMAQVQKQQETAVSGISEDPTIKKAQTEALSRLQSLGRTGIDQQGRSVLDQTNAMADEAAQSRQAQIMQQLQQQGKSDVNSQLVAQMAAQQDAANLASTRGDQRSSQAAVQALQALQNAGSLGGQVRNQDYSQQSAKAQAIDQMNRFNVQNNNVANQANTQAQNQAQANNLQNKQNISNANTQQTNQELLRQKQAQQQNFDNAMKKNGALSGALGQRADQFNDQADRTTKQWVDTSTGVGEIVGQAAGSMFGGV